MDAQKLIERDEETGKDFVESMKTKGYCVVSLTDRQSELLKDYRSKCEEFFDMPEEYKQSMKASLFLGSFEFNTLHSSRFCS